jgi:hypothetical protein
VALGNRGGSFAIFAKLVMSTTGCSVLCFGMQRLVRPNQYSGRIRLFVSRLSHFRRPQRSDRRTVNLHDGCNGVWKPCFDGRDVDAGRSRDGRQTGVTWTLDVHLVDC